jgi:hypothetical protein
MSTISTNQYAEPAPNATKTRGCHQNLGGLTPIRESELAGDLFKGGQFVMGQQNANTARLAGNPFEEP